MNRITVLILLLGTTVVYGQDIFSDVYVEWWIRDGYLNTMDGYINRFPPQGQGDSTFYHFMYWELSRYDMTNLRLLRNMVFAKYGYRFISKDLYDFFSRFPWYKGTKTNVDNELTVNEWTLVKFIEQIEANYPTHVPKELIGVWSCDQFGEDWWANNFFFSSYEKELKFYPNGVFSYSYTNDDGNWPNYWGLWSFKNGQFSVTFYFAGTEFHNISYREIESFVFDPNRHHNGNTTNFNEKIIFFNKNINTLGEEVWECYFQTNEKSWKKIQEDLRYHPPDH